MDGRRCGGPGSRECAPGWQDFVRAIRLAPVRLGLLGTVLLVVGSLSPAYLPQASPYWPVMRALGLDTAWARVMATVLVIGAVGLLIIAWYRLRPAVYHDVKPWAILCWWAIPLIAAPPIFSHDAYSYAAQGWLIENGLNPYEVSPSVLPGTFADQVAWLWRYTPVSRTGRSPGAGARAGPARPRLQPWVLLGGRDQRIPARDRRGR